MRISRKEFTRDAIQFCNAFKALPQENNTNPTALTQWKLVGDISNEHTMHISHPPITCEVVDTAIADDEDDTNTFEYEDDTLLDADTVSPTKQLQKVEWRLSIVFSDTWMVPMLYFTVKQSDGTPYLRSQVLKLLNTNDIQDTWDFVSYEEHPMTGEPSFFLHPCQTSEKLSLLCGERNQATISPLLSWVTMILPAVGFSIPTMTFAQVKDWIANQERRK